MQWVTAMHPTLAAPLDVPAALAIITQSQQPDWLTVPGTEGLMLTAPYGVRARAGKLENHQAWDIHSHRGQQIFAPCSGRVNVTNKGDTIALSTEFGKFIFRHVTPTTTSKKIKEGAAIGVSNGAHFELAYWAPSSIPFAWLANSERGAAETVARVGMVSLAPLTPLYPLLRVIPNTILFDQALTQEASQHPEALRLARLALANGVITTAPSTTAAISVWADTAYVNSRVPDSTIYTSGRDPHDTLPNAFSFRRSLANLIPGSRTLTLR